MYFNAISIYRAGRLLKKLKIPIVPRIFEICIYIFCNCSIPLSAQIGKGTYCGHRGIGVVIHPDAVIGENCLIRAHVVIGGRGGDIPGAPRIGDGVEIGAGAKILGDIAIGDGAIIGSNAVVVDDVPPGTLVVGIPAKPLKK